MYQFGEAKPVVHYHKPCPDRYSSLLTESDKRRGLINIKQIRHELYLRQLSPLLHEQQGLIRQLHNSLHVLARVRLRIRLLGVEKRIDKIRKRWL